ncbi:uncharacterized protein [Takifugu rubripes]|uniref:uncharacterized protein n=1 Tax=Takifugu rubripes TaxID=31033 RepID=UPI0011452FA6|nr:uncharacterized protein LOC115251437 [Takifugu rubripes]
MAHFVPLPKLLSAKETAQLVIQHIFRLHGLPERVVSDRGPQFASVFWKEFWGHLGAIACLSSGFHPQTNGQMERINQDLEMALLCMATRDTATWSTFLGWLEYAHNSLISSATGMSPFQCVFGYQPLCSRHKQAKRLVPLQQLMPAAAGGRGPRLGPIFCGRAPSTRRRPTGTGPRPQIQSGTTHVAIYAGPASSGGIQENGPAVCGTIPYRQSSARRQSDSGFPGQCTCTPPSTFLGSSLPTRAPWSRIARPYLPRC